MTATCAKYAQMIEGMVCSFVLVSNYDKSGQLENYVYHFHLTAKIKLVFAVAEFDLYRAHRMNQWLGLDHIPENILRIFRNKIAMKHYFSSKGVKTPCFAEVKSVLDIHDFIQKNGFPVVVKQQEGGGGVGTQILRSVADIEAFAQSDFRSNGFTEPSLMIESYVEGKLYHVDGFCYNNQIQYLSCGEYIHGLIDDFYHNFSLGSILLPNQSATYQKLKKAHEEVLSVIDVPMAFTFHAEYFIDQDDTVVLCEIACRTGGAGINQTNDLVRGVDLNAWLLDTLYHQRPAKVEQKNNTTSGGWVVFSLGRVRAKIKHIAKTCDLTHVVDYHCDVLAEQTIHPTVSNVQGICTAIFASEDEPQAALCYDDFIQWANEYILWQEYS
ncbi:hypothetical protein B0189_09185 [Moraxella cuniculi]|nr:hypothetical protein B0189_09185 [Moraxella cuniculi]